MITPRKTTLCRVPGLAAFRETLSNQLLELPVEQSGDTCILVPTRAAAEQLRRTVENRALAAGRQAVVWPVMATRRELYDELGSRLAVPPRPLSPFEREVILSAVARELLDAGLPLPFKLRPGLVAEMLALYDQVRRLGRTVADFERNISGELEREQDTDRGAARLMEQTAFLSAAYREYETRLAAAGRVDEHGLRQQLMQEPARRPLRRIIVTVADRTADADGVWPADFDLLARLPGLEHLQVVATEALLASGYIERLYALFPDFEETRATAPPGQPPVMVRPAGGAAGESSPLCFSHRDREEELAGVVRRLKQQQRDGQAAPLHRTAIVVQRPLPYLYLARAVFDDANISFETLDTLPLAAEPYAAAVDLVLDAVAADFTRSTLMALLGCPHFDLGPGAADAAAIAACDFALADARYLGELDRLQALVERWSAETPAASRNERRQRTAAPAARAVLTAVQPLAPLAATRPLTAQFTTLLDWLQRHDRDEPADSPTRSRRARVRAAVLGALSALRNAYAQHDPGAEGDIATVTAALRRWLGSQTFALPTGGAGLQIVDAQAARYADFDDVQIVGLIEGEWPERARRNVLYPSSLLALLEPLPAVADASQRERDALRAARASFKDLLFSAAQRVRLSAFALEHDAVVEPAILLDEVPAFALPTAIESGPPARVLRSEALALEPRRHDVIPSPAAEWAAVRLAPDTRPAERLRGEAGAWTLPRVSVSRLELYLNCPFKFYATHVLKLEEHPEDADLQTPLERGRFLHELWERFFAAWQARGHGRIDPGHLVEARALFTELCEEALTRLSPAEAALERHRLLGSAVRPGIAHRVFAMEAGKPTPILERLLELSISGDFVFTSREGHTRTVTLNAKTDRIDVLEGRALRVIDYKSKNTPDLKVALQLPVYSHLARESLSASRGGEWTLAETLYVSFEGDKAVVPLRPAKGQTLDDVIADAQDRLIRALDDIAAGRFPARPAKKSLCNSCSYRAVCRLDIVAEPAEVAGE